MREVVAGARGRGLAQVDDGLRVALLPEPRHAERGARHHVRRVEFERVLEARGRVVGAVDVEQQVAEVGVGLRLRERRGRHLRVEFEPALEGRDLADEGVGRDVLLQLLLHRGRVALEGAPERLGGRHALLRQREVLAELRQTLPVVAEDQVVDERPRLRVEEAPDVMLVALERVLRDLEELRERDELLVAQQAEVVVDEAAEVDLAVVLDGEGAVVLGQPLVEPRRRLARPQRVVDEQVRVLVVDGAVRVLGAAAAVGRERDVVHVVAGLEVARDLRDLAVHHGLEGLVGAVALEDDDRRRHRRVELDVGE